MKNFRIEFQKQNLKTVMKYFSHLQKWEQEFITGISALINSDKELTQLQFNTLKKLADESNKQYIPGGKK